MKYNEKSFVASATGQVLQKGGVLGHFRFRSGYQRFLFVTNAVPK
jgi:hypothetical protein